MSWQSLVLRVAEEFVQAAALGGVQRCVSARWLLAIKRVPGAALASWFLFVGSHSYAAMQLPFPTT
jgi:hypothetical protein